MERPIKILPRAVNSMMERAAAALMEPSADDLLPKLPSYYPQKGHTYPLLRAWRHMWLWLIPKEGGKAILHGLPVVREPMPENPSRQVRRRLARPVKVRPATRDRRWREAQGRRAS